MEKYDYIIVLSPEVNKEKEIEKRFPEFKDGMYVGGLTRMKAACQLFKNNKKAKFIIVGGYDFDGSSRKTESMHEFLEKYGCKAEKIPSLPCTHHNLVAVFNKKKKELRGKKIGLLTNFYHLPRALRFWRELVEEEFNNVPMPFPICVESVVGIPEEMYIRYIEFLIRINDEIKGIGAIEKDLYHDKCLNEKLEYFKEIIDKNNNVKLLLTKKEQEIWKKKILKQN